MPTNRWINSSTGNPKSIDVSNTTGNPVKNPIMGDYGSGSTVAAYIRDTNLSSSDANYVVSTVNSKVFLAVITADRVLSLPAPNNQNVSGRTITIVNRNTNLAYNWTLNLPVLYPNVTDTLTVIPRNSVVEVYSDGVNWRLLSIYSAGQGLIALSGNTIDFSFLPDGCIIEQDISSDTTYTFSNRIPGKKIEFSILNTSASDVTIDFTGATIIAESNVIPAGKEAMVSIIAVRSTYRVGIAIQS